jgi:3-demethoxyubiquinol 3-hydroxylase
MTDKTKTYSSKDGRLPGDLSREQLLERIIRVDQAGEFGAVRIYEGQLSVLGKSDKGPIIRDMLAQEVEHLDTFNKMVGKRRVRPTALMPLWHLAGFALGAGTALLGEKAAMACTVAVEEVIDEHYADQIEKLDRMGGDEKDLSELCEKFRQDELDHRDTGLEHGAEQAPGYEGLSALIKTGSRMAIWLSERI